MRAFKVSRCLEGVTCFHNDNRLPHTVEQTSPPCTILFIFSNLFFVAQSRGWDRIVSTIHAPSDQRFAFLLHGGAFEESERR